jgi:hypothetical protein
MIQKIHSNSWRKPINSAGRWTDYSFFSINGWIIVKAAESYKRGLGPNNPAQVTITSYKTKHSYITRRSEHHHHTNNTCKQHTQQNTTPPQTGRGSERSCHELWRHQQRCATQKPQPTASLSVTSNCSTMGDYPQATHTIVDCHTLKNQV